MPAPGPSTVGPAAICEGHSLLAPTSWRRHGNSKQQSHPLEVTPRVPGPTILSLASPQSPDPIFWPQVPRPTGSHSLNRQTPKAGGQASFKQNKKASCGKMWHHPFRARPLTPPRQQPPESPFSHPPFEREHGHCPPVGNLACGGPGEGGRSPRCLVGVSVKPRAPSEVCTAGSTLAAVFQSGGDSGDGWRPAWCPC